MIYRDWSLVFLGALGGLLYCGLIRPFLKKLIQKTKQRWARSKTVRNQNAFAAGYGWAWAAAKCEDKSVYQIGGYIQEWSDDTAYGHSFDQGIKEAMEDIQSYTDSGLNL